MRFMISAAAIMSLSLSGTFAIAGDVRTTTAGVKIEIDHHATWDKNCNFGAIPWIEVTKFPGHGKISTEVHEHTITYNGSGGDTKCFGQTGKGVFVYYTPNKSFKGVDTVEYDVNYSDRRHFQHAVTINVN